MERALIRVVCGPFPSAKKLSRTHMEVIQDVILGQANILLNTFLMLIIISVFLMVKCDNYIIFINHQYLWQELRKHLKRGMAI